MADYTYSATLSALDAMLKNIYPNEYADCVSPFNIFCSEVPFNTAERVGKAFVKPIVLTMEGGVTVLSASSGITALNDPITATVQDASVDGAQVFVRSAIETGALFKTMTDRQAFKKATEYQIKNLTTSAQKHRELQALYGGWLGTTTGTGTQSSPTVKITITDATWSSGTWSNMENQRVQFYNSTSLVSSGADSIFTVTLIDFANKAVTVTGTATGYTALAAALNTTGGVNLTAWVNGSYANGMIGIYKILTNTSTSIYGINAGTYSAWAGNQYNAGTGVLSPLDLFTASATAAGRGLMGEAMCFLPPKTWHNVMNAMTGLQRYDYSYDTKKADYGVAAISLITNVGKMTIYSHPLMKDGHAFILPKEGVSRIGATDIVFGDPSYPDRFIFPIPGFNASEIRAYFYHGVFVEKPSHGVYVYGFTNS